MYLQACTVNQIPLIAYNTQIPRNLNVKWIKIYKTVLLSNKCNFLSCLRINLHSLGPDNPVSSFKHFFFAFSID